MTRMRYAERSACCASLPWTPFEYSKVLSCELWCGILRLGAFGKEKWYDCVLCVSASPVGARLKREYQRTLATVLSEVHELQSHHLRGACARSEASERSPAQTTRLQESALCISEEVTCAIRVLIQGTRPPLLALRG